MHNREEDMEIASHYRHLLRELNEQRQHGVLCDVCVVVEGKVFKAHKNVLLGSSRYFKTLYCQMQKSAEQATVTHLDIVTAQGFTAIIDFTYSAHLALTSRNVIEVMSAASFPADDGHRAGLPRLHQGRAGHQHQVGRLGRALRVRDGRPGGRQHGGPHLGRHGREEHLAVAGPAHEPCQLLRGLGHRQLPRGRRRLRQGGPGAQGRGPRGRPPAVPVASVRQGGAGVPAAPWGRRAGLLPRPQEEPQEQGDRAAHRAASGGRPARLPAALLPAHLRVAVRRPRLNERVHGDPEEVQVPVLQLLGHAPVHPQAPHALPHGRAAIPLRDLREEVHAARAHEAAHAGAQQGQEVRVQGVQPRVHVCRQRGHQARLAAPRCVRRLRRPRHGRPRRPRRRRRGLSGGAVPGRRALPGGPRRPTRGG
uniref:BTB domain-containing protein n=1 Tax=Oryctolagus cuniculus TaxID=9986 RepID=G1TXH1_RABIT